MLNPFRAFRRRAASGANAPHLRLGRAGEEAAAAEARARGWIILDRNWRYGHLELDLVCEDRGEIGFLEVRTRTERYLVSPAESLTPEKCRRLVRAAQAWLGAHDAWERPCRFDLACVTAADGGDGPYRTEILSHVIEQ